MARRKTGAVVNSPSTTPSDESAATIKIDNDELSTEEQSELLKERAAEGGNLQRRTQQSEIHSERKVRMMMEGSSPQAVSHPNVRGGICDYCGIVDPKQPSHMQYLLCQHYRDLAKVESVPGYKGLRCSYCPAGLNALELQDILLHRVFQVKELVEKQGELIVVCDDLRCRDKHIKRFTVNA